jgi:membrane protein YqaA with SNARE-associated domain
VKHAITGFIAKYKAFVLAILTPLGIWGAALAGFVDSGTLPIPMDIIMATYAWDDRRHFYLYVLLAAAGSAVGGLIPFLLGRAGGEIFLLRRIDRVRYEQMMARFEKQEFLAMAVPSMMPPPTPWKAFAFAAGVFEMPLAAFMLAVFVGRLVRFGVEATLTVLYGPKIVNVTSELFQRHLAAALVGLGIVIGLIVLWARRKSRLRQRNDGQARLSPAQRVDQRAGDTAFEGAAPRSEGDREAP